MYIRRVFLDSAGNVRSGWRFAVFLLSFIVVAASAVGVAAAVAEHFNRPLVRGSLRFMLVNSTLSLIAALLAGWLCLRFLENLPFRSLGCWFTRGWFRDLILGCLIGSGTLLIAIGIAWAFGGFGFRVNRDHGMAPVLITLGVSLVVLTLAGAFEEVFFRGYMLQTFARAGFGEAAVVLTAVLFAVAHTGNEGAGVLSTINTALAGIWFGAAYLKTRNLWFPTGIHVVWNWMQGAVFGIEISGIRDLTTAPVLRELDAGPSWLTGGAYGIEGSVACTFALIVSIAAIWKSPYVKADEELMRMTSRG